jgi:hypothetical protein
METSRRAGARLAAGAPSAHGTVTMARTIRVPGAGAFRRALLWIFRDAVRTETRRDYGERDVAELLKAGRFLGCLTPFRPPSRRRLAAVECTVPQGR